MYRSESSRCNVSVGAHRGDWHPARVCFSCALFEDGVIPCTPLLCGSISELCLPFCCSSSW